jgi:hypothetical protein
VSWIDTFDAAMHPVVHFVKVCCVVIVVEMRAMQQVNSDDDERYGRIDVEGATPLVPEHIP